VSLTDVWHVLQDHQPGRSHPARCNRLSRGGDVYLLGSAYAFGVAWTFVLNTSPSTSSARRSGNQGNGACHSTSGGRRKCRSASCWFSACCCRGLVQRAHDEVGTIGGAVFTVAMVMLFSASESSIQKRRAGAPAEQFNLIRRLPSTWRRSRACCADPGCGADRGF